MYAQLRTRPDIAYAISVIGSLLVFQSNLGWISRNVAKKVKRYLQQTKDFMLVDNKMKY